MVETNAILCAARERRDYLYRRALTLQQAELASKRSALKASLASGKLLDPSIANDESLRRDYKVRSLTRFIALELAMK